jgi:hypothetical protein
VVVPLRDDGGSTVSVQALSPLTKLRESVRRRLGEPSIVVESAEGARFAPEDNWDHDAQKELYELYDETIDSLRQERAERERAEKERKIRRRTRKSSQRARPKSNGAGGTVPTSPEPSDEPGQGGSL